MINPVLYYSIISCIAESIPCIKTRVRSANYSIIEPFLAIISHRTYNMDNYSSKICVTPRKYFICLIYFALYTWIPLFVQCFIFTLSQKVFNQKIQGYILQNFYIKNKLTIIYNECKRKFRNCKLLLID